MISTIQTLTVKANNAPNKPDFDKDVAFCRVVFAVEDEIERLLT